MPEPRARVLRTRLSSHRQRVVVLTDDDHDVEPDLVLVDPYDAQGTLHPDRLVRGHHDLRYAVVTSGPMVETLMWLLVESALEHRLLGWLSPDLTTTALVDACERMSRGEVVIATRTGTRRPRTDPDELTQRELDVLRLVARGFSNREIATVLALSPNTVKTYIRLAYRRIGVESRSQAVLWAVGRGLHEDPDDA
jgi:DNA-binding NarL/FixJ family response regulator